MWLGTSATAAAAGLSLSPGAGSYFVGDTFQVDVVADSGGQNVVVADAIVEYDPALVELQSIDTSGSDFAYDFGLADPNSFPIKAIDQPSGRGQVVVALPTPGVNGASLRVATLTFKALAAFPTAAVNLNYTSAGVSGDSNVVQDDGLGTDLLASVGNGSYELAVAPDTDGDGVADNLDNCIQIPNPDQLNSNAGVDPYGNRCDADLNNDGFVNIADLAAFKAVFGSSDADADLDGSGFVNIADLAIFKSLFGKPPGPSGLAP